MNNIDQNYLNLLQDILINGHKKMDRTGTGTISVFGRQIRHDMSLGFPLLTTKKVAFNQIKSELKWFLRGSTDIRDLWKDKNHIWDGDWYKKYKTTCSTPYSLDEMIEFGLSNTPNFFSEHIWNLGPIYGHQWRNWGGTYSTQVGNIVMSSSKGVDQIQKIVDELQHNPNSRRIMVNSWNVDEIKDMTLPPCHYGFQFYTKELTFIERKDYYYNIHSEESKELIKSSKIDTNYLDKIGVPYRKLSLMWNQRSVDTPLGLPFNIASYGLLLELIADEVNMIPDELIGNLGDVHIYLNQLEGIYDQLKRTPKELPTIKIQDGIYSNLSSQSKDVILENYNPHPKIKFPLSN